MPTYKFRNTAGKTCEVQASDESSARLAAMIEFHGEKACRLSSPMPYVYGAPAAPITNETMANKKLHHTIEYHHGHGLDLI